MERIRLLWDWHEALESALSRIRQCLEARSPERDELAYLFASFEEQLTHYRDYEQELLSQCPLHRGVTESQRICAEYAYVEPRILLKARRLVLNEDPCDDAFMWFELDGILERLDAHMQRESCTVLPFLEKHLMKEDTAGGMSCASCENEGGMVSVAEAGDRGGLRQMCFV